MQNGSIDVRAYASQMNAYISLQEKYNIYQQICEEARIVSKNPGRQLIYENGYKHLFGFEGSGNLIEYLIVCATLCVFCAPMFALEKQTRMKRLINTMALGREKTVSAKLLICGYAAAGIGVFSLAPNFILILRDYWFSAPTAPIRSMNIFELAPINMPVVVLVALLIITRIVACFLVAVVVLAISEKVGNTIVAIIVSTILFCLVPLLALAGLDNVTWISAFPLFDFSVLMANMATAVAAWCYLLICLAASGLCSYWLYGRYPKNFYVQDSKE